MDVEIQYLRDKLKRWEAKFETKYGRTPASEDIAKYPDVGKQLIKVVSEYHRLRVRCSQSVQFLRSEKAGAFQYQQEFRLKNDSKFQ
jgi:hypothetical protein